jgi:hypothetical protein
MSLTSSNHETARDRFYRLRSDRTAKCLDGRLPPEIHCIVSVDDHWRQVAETTTALETLCNLLGRFCRRVSVLLPAHQRSSIDGDGLVAVLKRSDPFGEFTVTPNLVEADLHLRLGGGGGPAGRTIYWSFYGWTGSISNVPHQVLQPSGENRVGAEVAACLVGAAAFRFWQERSITGIGQFGFDLFRLAEVAVDSTGHGAVDISTARALKVLVVGAGSVGSATAYFLPRLGFRGFVDIVDHDIVKVENLDRSPIFALTNVDQDKAEAVTAYLTSKNIGAKGHSELWDDFVKSKAKILRSHDVWLPLANEHGVRRAMQANYPPMCLQASTGRNWNVNFGRHIPFVDDCQVDRFPDESSVPLACAEGAVEAAPGKKSDAALPFCSFLAGLFVAAAVMRLALGQQQVGDNAAFLSVSPTFSLWTLSREPHTRCICQEMNRALWEQIWARRPADGVSHQIAASGELRSRDGPGPFVAERGPDRCRIFQNLPQ